MQKTIVFLHISSKQLKLQIKIKSILLTTAESFGDRASKICLKHVHERQDTVERNEISMIIELDPVT